MPGPQKTRFEEAAVALSKVVPYRPRSFMRHCIFLLALLLANLSRPALALETDFIFNANSIGDARVRALQQTLFKMPKITVEAPWKFTMEARPLRISRPRPSAAFSPATALAVRDLALQPTDLTPYDRYLGSIRAVIAELDGRGASMTQTCTWMKVAHHFRYEVWRSLPRRAARDHRADRSRRLQGQGPLALLLPRRSLGALRHRQDLQGRKEQSRLALLAGAESLVDPRSHQPLRARGCG